MSTDLQATAGVVIKDFQGYPQVIASENLATICDPANADQFGHLDNLEQLRLAVYSANEWARTADAIAALIPNEQENYAGESVRLADWVENYLDECGELSNLTDLIRNHLDFDAMWSSSFTHDFWAQEISITDETNFVITHLIWRSF
jgi:antirestriction protein